MQRVWIGIGGVAGFLAVAMAAAAAHIAVPQAYGAMRSAVEMQGWHALALICTGLWSPRGGRLTDGAGFAFTLGMLLFCGALYSLALSGVSLGPVAPAGGTLLMIGWLMLAAAGIRGR